MDNDQTKHIHVLKPLTFQNLDESLTLKLQHNTAAGAEFRDSFECDDETVWPIRGLTFRLVYNDVCVLFLHLPVCFFFPFLFVIVA